MHMPMFKIKQIARQIAKVWSDILYILIFCNRTTNLNNIGLMVFVQLEMMYWLTNHPYKANHKAKILPCKAKGQELLAYLYEYKKFIC